MTQTRPLSLLATLAAALLCAVSAQAASPAAAAPKPSTAPALVPRRLAIGGGQSYRDLEYSRPDGIPLGLDLYIPSKPAGPLPVILYVHGGSWRAGNKGGAPWPSFLARGYALASIDYRLSQVAKFPAQAQDCKAAVRWLRSHAAQYDLDPNRIGAFGTSAGGHLVALLGTSAGAKELEGDPLPAVSSRVQAVVDWYGPVDLLARGPGRDKAGSPDGQLIGGPLHENKEKCILANPITYITPDDPPFLIMHGDKDGIVPLAQSQLLYDALKKANLDATFIIVPGQGHGFSGKDPMTKSLDFFDKHLKGMTLTLAPATRSARQSLDQ